MQHHRRRAQLGLSSVVMLSTVVPLMVVAGTMLTVESAHLRETQNLEARARARAIAAGGAHEAVARLQDDPLFTGTFTVELEAGQAVVTVVDCAGDGEDNEGDGRVDDAGEIDLVAVRSEGFLGFDLDDDGSVVADHGRNWRGRTDVLLRRLRLDVPFDAAMYVDDPLADVRFSGNSFLVSGFDVDLNGRPILDVPHPAIGTPGNPKSIRSRLRASQRDNIIGEGLLPSVQESPLIDLDELIATFAPLASMRFEDGASFHGTIGDRSKLEPAVAYAAGDLKISGKTTGCGILLVDGDLEIGGAFDFAGIVVVARSVRYRGGGNRAVLGTMLTGQGLEFGAELKGSMTIQYCSAAIDVASVAASSFEVLAWRQG